MPEWEKPSQTTADEVLSAIMNSKQGDSGSFALEGDEALKALSHLLSGDNIEGAQIVGSGDVPKELQDLLAGSGVNLARAIVIKKSKDDPSKDDLSSAMSREEFVKKFTSTTAEEDEEYQNVQRPVVVDGSDTGTISYAQLRHDARSLMEAAERGKQPAAIGGMALSILWLLDQIDRSSNLLRSQEALLQKQRELMAEGKRHLEKYRDHMIIEHGVTPEGLED